MTGAAGTSGRAGWPQGLALMAMAWVASAAAVTIAPVLPTLAATFHGTPDLGVKIALVASGPALLVALLALPYGALADRVGRRRLLITALGLYGAAGLAPLLLGSLDAIVVSRLAVGVAEAAVMTCATALIGDYFEGRARVRWLAYQAGSAPLAAIVLVLIGGALGHYGWRAPFLVYAFGWVLAPVAAAVLWEPGAPAARRRPAPTEPFDWRKPMWIAAVMVFSMVAFMVTVVQFSFLVTERGMAAPQQIGFWSAVVTAANPAGSLLFGLVRGRTSTKFALAYGLFAAGFCTMGLLTTVPGAVGGALLANLGAGIMLPSGLTWMLACAPGSLRGQAAGLFTASNFLGQFLGPLVMLALRRATGDLSGAIVAMGVACAAAGLIGLLHRLTVAAPPADTAYLAR